MSDLTLQIAASGIEADEAELDTSAQNLSNVSTPGYAQEVVNLANTTPAATTGVGQGVSVQSVTENTSSLFDQLNLVSQGQLGFANEAASLQNLAQNAFPEPSTSGLSSQMSQLWTDLSTLATQPSSAAAQQTVVSDANQVSQTLNSTYSQLSDVAQQLSNDFEGQGTTSGGYLSQANQLLNQVATLNGDIVAGQNGGSNVNSLVDQRRQAVDQLGTLLGVRTTTEADGSMTVSSGGIQLVNDTTAVALQATGAASSADLAVETSAGNVLSAGGQIGALLTGVNSTIPQYQSQLSSVADSLATNLNTLQANGVSASGIPGAASSAAAPPYAGEVLPSIFVNNSSATTYTAGRARRGRSRSTRPFWKIRPFSPPPPAPRQPGWRASTRPRRRRWRRSARRPADPMTSTEPLSVSSAPRPQRRTTTRPTPSHFRTRRRRRFRAWRGSTRTRRP